jgi:hypothetical protein
MSKLDATEFGRKNNLARRFLMLMNDLNLCNCLNLFTIIEIAFFILEWSPSRVSQGHSLVIGDDGLAITEDCFFILASLDNPPSCLGEVKGGWFGFWLQV